MARAADSTRPFVEDFAARKSALPGMTLPWLGDLRQAAIARFGDLGVPTPRVEAWKYTRLKPLEKLRYRAVTGTDASAAVAPVSPLIAGGLRLVFVNGRLRRDLSALGSLPAGVTIEAFGDALARDAQFLERHLGRVGVLDGQPMLALNTALMDDGFVVRVAKGTTLAQPIEVTYLGGTADAPVAYHPRNLIVLEEGAAATLIEHHAGTGGGAYFVNGATEIRVGAGARLSHGKVQEEGAEALHLATMHAEVGRNAVFESVVLSFGARLSRNEVTVRLAGRGAECRLNGAYMMRGDQHCDNTTIIEHLVPDTRCREVFKGVLDDHARGVFQGRIVVHRDAQRTDGHQLCKTLLLSERAEIDAKPELEIYADDVKCSHGAAAGALDAEALFYLRSRGIPEAVARGLLVRSFLAETLEGVGHEGFADAALARIGGWLENAKGEGS